MVDADYCDVELVDCDGCGAALGQPCLTECTLFVAGDQQFVMLAATRQHAHDLRVAAGTRVTAAERAATFREYQATDERARKLMRALDAEQRAAFRRFERALHTL